MLLVALAALAVAAATVIASASLLRSQQRAHARREDALLDRLMHASGRTWTPPPADRYLADEPIERDTVRVPEAFPDGDFET